MKWNVRHVDTPEFTCVYGTVRGVNVLFPWAKGFPCCMICGIRCHQRGTWLQEARKVGFYRAPLRWTKRVGLDSLQSVYFLPSCVLTEQTHQREDKVALSHIFILNGVRLEDIDIIQEGKRTHCGLLSCSHVWAWIIPTAYLNYAFSSFLLTRIILIYWC